MKGSRCIQFCKVHLFLHHARGDSSIGGMRMDANGNTEFHGTLRATQLHLDVQWWSDFVFADNYRLRSVYDLEKKY